MGYRTKKVARATLPGAKTALLAVIVPDVPDRFFHEILEGAKEAANAAQHTLLVVDAQRSAVTERTALDRLVPVVDGVILAGSTLPDTSIRVIARQRPTVVVNRAMTDVASVLTDSAGGTRQAVAHLAALGHRELTYLAGPSASWTDGTRWRAFRAATRQHGLRARRIGPNAPTPRRPEAWCSEHFTHHVTSGVIAFNDFIAVGFMRGLADLGVACPTTSASSASTTPSQAGANRRSPPSHHHCGTSAARLCAWCCSSRPSNAVGPHRRRAAPTHLPAQLVVRSSTAPARSKSNPTMPEREHAA